jgi:hypothetical protein
MPQWESSEVIGQKRGAALLQVATAGAAGEPALVVPQQ